MRKLFLLILMAGLFTTLYTGCDKATSALDVDFDANYDTNIKAEVPEAARAVAFSAMATVDPATDENVKKYGNKIKQVQIQSAMLEIVSVSKQDVGLEWGKVKIYPTGNESDPLNVTWDIAKMPLVVGENITLGNENGQWNNLAEILKQLKVFDVVIEGETDQGMVTIVFKLKIQTKVTANPL